MKRNSFVLGLYFQYDPGSEPGEFEIETSNRNTIITMLSGTFTLATMAALVHSLGGTYHWSFIVFTRIFLTFLLTIVAARLMGVRPTIFGSKVLWARSIFGTIAMVSNFYALTHLNITDALTILKTSPIWVSILVAVLNRRMHSKTMWLAVAVGFAGVVVMEQPKFEGNALPILVATFSAVFIASAQVSMGYLKHIPTINIVIHFSGCASLTTFLVFLILRQSPTMQELAWENGRWLLLMAMLGTIGQILMTTAFRKGNPMLMALVGLSSIPLAAAYDHYWFENPIQLVQVIGIGLIAVSITLCSRDTLRQNRELNVAKEVSADVGDEFYTSTNDPLSSIPKNTGVPHE
jgi:drug/metabolite transporter (DMT)-like permease